MFLGQLQLTLPGHDERKQKGPGIEEVLGKGRGNDVGFDTRFGEKRRLKL